MHKIIGADGKEYGPIPLEALRQWIAEGRINGETLVQPAGQTEWVRAATVPELAALLPGAAAVAGAPATPRGTAPAEPPADYVVQTGAWISAGWELVKANLGLLVGATLVILLIQGAAQAVPFIGGIAGAIITGPLYGGLYWLNLRLIRGEPAEFGDAFAGFTRGFVALMLAQVIMTLVMVVALVPGAVAVVAGALAWDSATAAALPLLVFGGLLAAAGFCVAVYYTINWMFALALVVDRRLDFWPALKLSQQQVRKHWWGMFGFFLLVAVVAVGGVLLCCIGLLLTMPIAMAALMHAYEDLFGPRATAAA